MEVLYFITSGAHRSLPFEELEALHQVYGCPYDLLSVHFNVAIARGKYDCSKKIMRRAAYIKEMGEVCAICDEVSCNWFADCKPGRVRAKKLGGLEVREVRLSLDGNETVKVIYVEGFAIVGRNAITRAMGRSPKGPFFSPGSMDPLLARALVNLSRAREGKTFLDPFCGTGVIAHEASRVGALALCSDLDPSMAYGSRINTQHLGLSCEHLIADAVELPFKSSSIVAIATDPPYGRSVLSLGHEPEELMLEFLKEARRVLKPGAWIAFASSTGLDASSVVRRAGLRVNKCHVMRVHKSLARFLCTAYRD